jgi:hypothetical protein
VSVVQISFVLFSQDVAELSACPEIVFDFRAQIQSVGEAPGRGIPFDARVETLSPNAQQETSGCSQSF